MGKFEGLEYTIVWKISSSLSNFLKKTAPGFSDNIFEAKRIWEVVYDRLRNVKLENSKFLSTEYFCKDTSKIILRNVIPVVRIEIVYVEGSQ